MDSEGVYHAERVNYHGYPAAQPLGLEKEMKLLAGHGQARR